MSGKKTRRLVLLGKTGTGKSSLANTIVCKKDKFKISDSASSVTKKTESYMTKGKTVHLIDTPGVFDTDPNSPELSPEILKCVAECEEGVHAFLLVLNVGRYTQQEQAVVDLILKYFSEEALKYTVLVFTHGNELEGGQSIVEWASENEALRTLVQKCGGCCHVVDNKHWNKTLKNRNKKQIKELFKTIDKKVEENGGCYKNAMMTTDAKPDQSSTGGWFQTCYKWINQEAIPVGVILAAFLGAVQLVKSGGAWVLYTKVAQGVTKGANALVKTLGWASKWWASPAEAVKEGNDFMKEMEHLFQQVKKTCAAAAGIDPESSSCTIQDHTLQTLKRDMEERAHTSSEDTSNTQDKTKEIRIMLLGKTGSGKSHLGNTILNKDTFKTSSSSKSVTKDYDHDTVNINGKNVKVIDTPGVFDTDQDKTDLGEKFYNCVQECGPGPHAFLLVLKVERYSPQEQGVVKEILKYFSEEALKYTTVVFTHGEQLEEGQKIEDWYKENEALRSLVQKCGGRCHVFDNKDWNNQVQVTELLRTIEETVEENGGGCYNNGFWKHIKHMKVKGVPLKYLLAALFGGAAVGAVVGGLSAAFVAKLLFDATTATAVATGAGTSVAVGGAVGGAYSVAPDEVSALVSSAVDKVTSGSRRKMPKMSSSAMKNVTFCMGTSNKSKTS